MTPGSDAGAAPQAPVLLSVGAGGPPWSAGRRTVFPLDVGRVFEDTRRRGDRHRCWLELGAEVVRDGMRALNLLSSGSAGLRLAAGEHAKRIGPSGFEGLFLFIFIRFRVTTEYNLEHPGLCGRTDRAPPAHR